MRSEDGQGIAAFFAARLDEDEAAAKALIGGEWTGDWEVCRNGEVRDSGFEPRLLNGVIHDRAAWRTVDVERHRRASAEATHIARHDPARVLREVEADRKLLAEWEDADQHRYDLPPGVHEGRDDDERIRDDAEATLLDRIVAIRAARFSDHPDYQPGWKP